MTGICVCIVHWSAKIFTSKVIEKARKMTNRNELQRKCRCGNRSKSIALNHQRKIQKSPEGEKPEPDATKQHKELLHKWFDIRYCYNTCTILWRILFARHDNTFLLLVFVRVLLFHPLNLQTLGNKKWRMRFVLCFAKRTWWESQSHHKWQSNLHAHNDCGNCDNNSNKRRYMGLKFVNIPFKMATHTHTWKKTQIDTNKNRIINGNDNVDTKWNENHLTGKYYLEISVV